VSVVLSAEEYERLRRLDQANAPSLAELLLQIPQDDEPFERLPLAVWWAGSAASGRRIVFCV
jgi:hypothetical protein